MVKRELQEPLEICYVQHFPLQENHPKYSLDHRNILVVVGTAGNSVFNKRAISTVMSPGEFQKITGLKLKQKHSLTPSRQITREVLQALLKHTGTYGRQWI